MSHISTDLLLIITEISCFDEALYKMCIYEERDERFCMQARILRNPRFARACIHVLMYAVCIRIYMYHMYAHCKRVHVYQLAKSVGSFLREKDKQARA